MEARHRPEDSEEFHEAMPQTAEQFGYHWEIEQVDPDTEADNGRLTALVMLLLVVLSAITLGLLFLRGLDTVKGAVPNRGQPAQQQPQSDASGSLEL
jgi:hypothetical protein